VVSEFFPLLDLTQLNKQAIRMNTEAPLPLTTERYRKPYDLHGGCSARRSKIY
jgi:hypothetical protein